jgi:acetyl/propionyl-CoA carboxylase alpha subunit
VSGVISVAPRPIRKVLIANRGEIARRIIRAARELGIKTAVVYSDADADALFVKESDEAVRLAGTAPADTYLVVDLLLDAAAQVGADAIHPGYGFLSENATFATACAKAGITFVGPSADAIRRMGDKLGAKQIMAAHGVPTLASVTVADGDVQDLDAIASSVGFPAIVKASAGGGGRGMRIVTEASELAFALDSARREAQAAFGNPTVFIERYLSPARHIEVQIVADSNGQVATLFERECSIQRRHQKLVEESPSPFVDSELREILVTAAEQAARAVDYLGAGTIEFVVGEDRTVAFLEMNTRLQVEHPVTEAITGVDLVREQFAVASGLPLSAKALNATVNGHAIEVRLCAEDPAAGHLPAAGTFTLFEVDAPGVRVDSGVQSGTEVSAYYDSMVAKVIAWGESRTDAASRLADALERARIHGVMTNRDLLVRVLRSDEFLAGDTTTDFLDRVPGLTASRTDAAAHAVHAAIAAVAVNADQIRTRGVQVGVPGGWRNNRTSADRLELDGAGQAIVVGYDLSGSQPQIDVDGEPIDLIVHGVTAGEVDATVRDVRRRYATLLLEGEVLLDSPLGASSFRIVERLPSAVENAVPEGGMTAPMPGTVTRVLVSVGQEVAAGEPLLILEAMKMEHSILSPLPGAVTALNVAVGDQVERDAVLAEVTGA